LIPYNEEVEDGLKRDVEEDLFIMLT